MISQEVRVHAALFNADDFGVAAQVGDFSTVEERLACSRRIVTFL